MAESSIRVGAATITPINVGLLRADIADWMRIPEDERRGYEAIFAQPLKLPIQCMLIQLPETTVLVDASLYDLPADSPYALPGYVPPPALLDQLAALGVSPDAIDHVIITHGHFDHFSGVTQERDGAYVPSFPNARFYMGKPDPEMWRDQLDQPDSFASYTLGVLMRGGLLELTSGDLSVTNSVQIIAAPGETLGHQIVRVHSDGQTAYCLGDLYHHPVEVERPEWMVHWADKDATHHSRERLVSAALAENATLIATHIPTIGRLERTASGVFWRDA